MGQLQALCSPEFTGNLGALWSRSECNYALSAVLLLLVLKTFHAGSWGGTQICIFVLCRSGVQKHLGHAVCWGRPSQLSAASGGSNTQLSSMQSACRFRDCMSDEHYVSSLLAASGEGHNTDCVGMAIHSNHSTGGLLLHCCAPLQLLLRLTTAQMGCLCTAAPCCTCWSLQS